MLHCQKQLGQWRNTKSRQIDLRTIYPLYLAPYLQEQMPAFLASYGQFWSDTTQAMTNSSTPLALTYDHSGPLKNIGYSGSQITVQSGGIYQIAFSIQFARASGNASTICDAWLRVNGTDVPDTATQVATPQGPTTSEIFMTVPIMLTLTAGQYIEVMFATDDPTNTKAYTFASQSSPYVRPAIPSIITTIIQIA